jgi:hypothetical protein
MPPSPNSEGVVVTLHLVKVDAAQVSGIDGGMAPEQHAAAILVPLADERSGCLNVGGDVPHVTLADTLKVTQPEEHTERLNIVDTLDIIEAYKLSGRIGLVQPEPCRSLVVVAILNQFFRSTIDTQETDGGLTNTERRSGGKRCTLFVLGYQFHFPCVASLHVTDGIVRSRAGESLIDGTQTIGGCQEDTGGIVSLVPLYQSVVAACLIQLAHLHTGDAGGTLTSVCFDDASRNVVAIRSLEYIFKRHVGGYILVRKTVAADGLGT